MRSIISDLWESEVLPIKDGIYFSDGRSFDVKMELFPNLVVEVGDQFNLSRFYAQNKDEVTSIDCLKVLQLSDGGSCCVGEGAYGSEGFIARLGKNESLMWAMSFEKSNPFIDIFESDDGCVIVKSSAGYSLIINLSNPVNIGLYK